MVPFPSPKSLWHSNESIWPKVRQSLCSPHLEWLLAIFTPGSFGTYPWIKENYAPGLCCNIKLLFQKDSGNIMAAFKVHSSFFLKTLVGRILRWPSEFLPSGIHSLYLVLSPWLWLLPTNRLQQMKEFCSCHWGSKLVDYPVSRWAWLSQKKAFERGTGPAETGLADMIK
jgi:hypothetical protein